jgi:leader peptidase (prepilin peptidase) / N-methyltransferase
MSILANPAGIGAWTSTHTAAATTAAIAAATSLLVAPDAQGLFGATLAMLMVAIALVDWRRYIIPDELTIAAFILGLAAAAFQNDGGVEEIAKATTLAAMRALLLSLAFLGLRQAYRMLRKRDGMGLGDVKLAAVAGAWLSWQTIPIVVEIAAIAALAAYAAHRCLFGHAFQPTHRLPFGLFFAPAIWLGWLLDTLNATDASRLTQFLPGG